ncbi:MAG: hypothetical protein M1817_005900 [Caeruleum heppii]|nr:MAG: hypothetical protein M1817_005900 [Caeruleum heppii]
MHLFTILPVFLVFFALTSASPIAEPQALHHLAKRDFAQGHAKWGTTLSGRDVGELYMSVANRPGVDDTTCDVRGSGIAGLAKCICREIPDPIRNTFTCRAELNVIPNFPAYEPDTLPLVIGVQWNWSFFFSSSGANPTPSVSGCIPGPNPKACDGYYINP